MKAKQQIKAVVLDRVDKTSKLVAYSFFFYEDLKNDLAIKKGLMYISLDLQFDSINPNFKRGLKFAGRPRTTSYSH